MTDVEKLQLIESYHSGLLSAEEQQKVEDLAKQDPDFAQELQDYLVLLDGFAGLELECFEAQLTQWESRCQQNEKVVETPVVALPQNKSQKTASIFSMRRFYAAAAVVALLLIAVPISLNYFSGSSDTLVADFLVTSNAPSRVRGSSDTIALDAAKETQKKMKETAFEAYNNKDYKTAVTHLDNYLNTYNPDHEVLFFLGAAKLYVHDAQSASRNLEQAADKMKGIYSQEAEFLLALAQLELKNTDACKRLLNAILSQTYHEYKEPAQKLLNKIK